VKRQAQYGPNQIEEKKTNEYLKSSYFWGPIPWMIEAAVILSGVVRHWLDFFVILALLCPTPWLLWEEHQRETIAALKARSDQAKSSGRQWRIPKRASWSPARHPSTLAHIVPA